MFNKNDDDYNVITYVTRPIRARGLVAELRSQLGGAKAK